MSNDKQTLIFLVDDDALYLKSLEIEFQQNRVSEVRTFATGELCLDNISQNPDIVILDYYLNSIDKNAIDGLQTLDKIKSNNPQIPVIMLSSQDDIEVAVNCLRHDAKDYFVKSETAYFRLERAIVDIQHNQKVQKTLNWYMDKA